MNIIIICLSAGYAVYTELIHEQEVGWYDDWKSNIAEPNEQELFRFKDDPNESETIYISIAEPNEPERQPFLKASQEFHDKLVAEYESLKDELSEPNEPNWHQLRATIHKDVPPGIYAIWASPGSEIKPFDITDLIPAWPQYIELEKDLRCFIPDDNDVCTVGDGIEHLLFPKGTKIYFK